MAFPLMDLPPEAVERVYASVATKRDRNSLRLVSKRSCALVDRGVTAVRRYSLVGAGFWHASVALGSLPWRHLRTLELPDCGFSGSWAESLVRADIQELQHLRLRVNRLGPRGAGVLARGYWPLLETLDLDTFTLHVSPFGLESFLCACLFVHRLCIK